MSLIGIFYSNDYVVIDDKSSDSKTGIAKTLANVGKRVKQKLGFVTGILIDATVSEIHTYDSEVVENPVEDGSDITDHINLKQPNYRLDGLITDTPLGLPLISNFQNAASRVQEVFGKNSRSINVMNSMLALRDTKKPFILTSNLKRYENMVFKSLEFSLDEETGSAIKISATLQQISIVKSKQVSVTPAESIKGLASKKADFGQQVTEPIPAGSQVKDQAEKSSNGGSFLYNLLN